MNVPDVTEKVLGFRAFQFSSPLGEVGLHSLAIDYYWKPGVNEAKCLNSRGGVATHHPQNPVPDHACRCGLYGYFDVPAHWAKVPRHFVIAAVRGWGRMEVHPGGFRAQYAEIIMFGKNSERVPLLGEQFGVPVVPLNQLAAEASKLAEPLSSAIVPSRSDPFIHTYFGTREVTFSAQARRRVRMPETKLVTVMTMFLAIWEFAFSYWSGSLLWIVGVVGVMLAIVFWWPLAKWRYVYDQ